ncbi:hypothetical protein P7C73_g5115, partial [Tremellales sp. Uapishka_1]
MSSTPPQETPNSPSIQEPTSTSPNAVAVEIAEGVDGEIEVPPAEANIKKEEENRGDKGDKSEDEVEGLMEGDDHPSETGTSEQPPTTAQDATPATADTPTIGLKTTPASIPSSFVRAPTPSSRTSTPPLAPGTTKKFSSVNVNKKFLGKAASPAPGASSAAAKPGSLGLLGGSVKGLSTADEISPGRPAAAPLPIPSTSARLLTTKLTSVPSSSPVPPPISSASSSPWAKPSQPAAEPLPIHHPAPTKRGGLVSTISTSMGSSQSIAAALPKKVWGPVVGEGGRKIGMTRDFPTAKEVADGQRAAVQNAQAAAQAQAAHNQAILQGLDVFTQIDPSSHRWDDEDDELDDVIDFGDRPSFQPHSLQPSAPPPLPIEPETTTHEPVPKSERFKEDFDRSWPRRSASPPRARDLFNASSNRLESIANRALPPPQPALPQPTRLIARGSKPSPGGFERPLPPHLAEGSRMLPPHMTQTLPPPHMTQTLPPPPPSLPQSHLPPARRPSWGHRDVERPQAAVLDRSQPPHLDRSLPPHLDRSEPSQTDRHPPPHLERSQPPPSSASDPPPRQSFSQTAVPPVVSPTTSHSAMAPVDSQKEEMHTAAEKARLRRLAEEAEREAAAERARMKARELEERFKGSSSSAQSKASAPIEKPVPTVILAARPREAAESTWRKGTAEEPSKSTRPTAESFFEQPPSKATVSPPTITTTTRTAPPVEVSTQSELVAAVAAVNGKKGSDFDDMLARLTAAMASARVAPPTVPAELPKPEPAKIAARPQPSQSPVKAPQPPPSQTKAPQPQSVTKSSQAQLSTESSQPQPPAPPPKKATPPPKVDHLPEFFDVTCTSPPKSPAPAWRTYIVKVPKVRDAKPAIAKWRIAASMSGPKPSPKGWFMTFEPPLDGLNASSLSRADLLLPTGTKRFQGPLVSISPRTLEMYEKKGKKKAVPSPTKAVRTEEGPNWRKPLIPTVEPVSAPVPAPSRKTRSPTKADKDKLYISEGVSIGLAERGRMPLPGMMSKPGVRFMVSSELEGDSLLDEVNKMSLETVGEGSSEKSDDVDRENGESSKTPGSETPKTPPSMSGGHPTSPNGTAPTWAKSTLTFPVSQSPARSSSQHDHIKHVWSQSPEFHPQQPIPAADNLVAPTYPSLNGPSPHELTPQAHPIKMSFSNSSSGGSGQSPAAFRSPAALTYSQFAPDQLPQHQYGRPNGFPSMSQNPNLWSSPGFGYGKQAAMEVKKNDVNSLSYAGDYRYTASPSYQPQQQLQQQQSQQGYYPAPSQPPHQSQQQQQQQQPAYSRTPSAPAMYPNPYAATATAQRGYENAAQSGYYGGVGGGVGVATSYGHIGQLGRQQPPHQPQQQQQRKPW